MTNDHAREAALLRRFLELPEYFAKCALTSHCRLPFAEFHRVLFDWQREMSRARPPDRRGLRFVLAAPRGNAKSTVASLALPLHDIVFAREEYILLLSATERQAMQRLRAIRRELQVGDAGRIAVRRATAEADRFTSGTVVFNGVRVDAMGAGTEIRGVLFNGFRPTKIILDDAEASSSASSALARERLAAWYGEVVEYLGDVYTHIVAVGTVLHEKGLMAKLLARPDFIGLRAPSIESFATRSDLWTLWQAKLMNFADPRRRESARQYFLANREKMLHGARVLWPEKEDYEDLMAQLTLTGRRAFYQEKQNAPLGAEDALFDSARALRATLEDGELLIAVVAENRRAVVRRYRAPHGGRRFCHLDASLGKGRANARGDFAAIATVLLLPDGSMVLERLLAERLPPSHQVARLFDLHAELAFDRVSIEGTGFQELLAPLVEEERARRRAASLPGADMPPVAVVHPRKSKAARIATLEPLLANGTLALGARLDEEFWEELDNYPRVRHDDALDAAAGAVELAQAAGATTGWERAETPIRNKTRGF